MCDQHTETGQCLCRPGLGGNRTVVMLVCLIYNAGTNLPGLSWASDSSVETL